VACFAPGDPGNPVSSGEPAAVWSTPQPDWASRRRPTPPASPSSRGNDLVVRSLADGKEIVAVRGDGRAIGGVA
jgi:hypothetical protein